MAKDTKERILAAALDLFSQNGYAGTNVRELTEALGLVKSSVYKHFKSKEEIWNTLLDEMIVYYDTRFGSAERLPPVPDSLEELVDRTLRMAELTIRDEKIIKTRMLLTIEQYRDDRARALATKHFLTGLTEMFTPIFQGMMEKGLLRQDDPTMLAFAYTAPISSLIHLCDREPEKTEEALAKIEAFSRHFLRTYGKYAPVTVRKLTAREIPAALELAWRVFSEYESPDNAPEGTEEFRKCLRDEAYLAGIDYYGAFDGETLAGMVGVRPDRNHICFFFVEGRYHRQGIGTRLFRTLLKDRPGQTVTLNSSPYGLPFYEALGFEKTAEEQTVNGIRFTPMKYEGRKRMKDFIAYCGLDCETCEARLATVNNDEALRQKVAAEWSELNGVEITPEMIHCVGCRIDGVKTPYCEALCPIRQCALEKNVPTCGGCREMGGCEKVAMILGNNADARKNLEQTE